MAVQTLETLKGYFKAGEYPTQSNYEDLIDTIFSMAQGSVSSDNNFLQVDVFSYDSAKTGDIVQHVGPTATTNINGDLITYTNGYVYQCVKNVKSGDWVITLVVDQNTVYNQILPEEGTYFTYQDVTFDDLSDYLTQGDTHYQIDLVYSDGTSGSSIYDLTNITDHKRAIDINRNVIEVIGYNNSYWRRTNSKTSSSGTTYETWQEVTGTAVVSPSVEWVRRNVQPTTGNVVTVSLTGYGSTGLSPYDFNYINSPYTPIQISDIAEEVGLAPDGVDYYYLDIPISTSILIVHNDGFWYGNNSPSENNEVYVSWKAGGREGASLAMSGDYTDLRYWDGTNLIAKPQIVVIPCGCSVSFGLTVGGWQPLGTFTPISASDLQAKENEYLNNQ